MAACMSASVAAVTRAANVLAFIPCSACSTRAASSTRDQRFVRLLAVQHVQEIRRDRQRRIGRDRLLAVAQAMERRHDRREAGRQADRLAAIGGGIVAVAEIGIGRAGGADGRSQRIHRLGLWRAAP